MVTSPGHYWTKCSHSNQQFKILHQYSNLAIMVSKVNCFSVKNSILYLSLHVIWQLVSLSDRQESWLTYEGCINQINFSWVCINLKMKSRKLTPAWKWKLLIKAGTVSYLFLMHLARASEGKLLNKCLNKGRDEVSRLSNSVDDDKKAMKLP